MISVYVNNETSFIHNGIVLPDIVSCTIEEILNGKYVLELTYPIDDNGKWEHLVEENIIKADGQLFRIHSTEKNLNYVYVYARHIFYDLLHNFLEDVRPTNINGSGALNWILLNTQYPHNFVGMSNIATLSTQYYIRKNPIEAMLGDDSLVTRWGGEIERDNYTIKLLTSLGSNKGAQIAYGKNMLGLDIQKDMDTTITRIMPVGNDGLLLPEKYIDSPLINNYAFPRIATIEFDIGINDETTELQAFDLLRQSCNDLYTLNKVDIPYININTNLLMLENTEEYKHIQSLIKVNLGDTVSCTDNPLKILFESRVIRIKKDILSNKNVEVELGQLQKGMSDTLNNAIKDISEVIQHNVSDLQNAINVATELLTNALGGYVVKRVGEILIMDTEDINTATQIWRWNLNGLGYSNSGINGPYEVAMTMDGKINANFITTGTLSAGIIKTGVLSSNDNSTWINLDDGSFNFKNKVKFIDDVFTIAISSDDIDLSDIYNHNIILSNENQAIPTDSSGKTVIAQTVTSTIDAYKGINKVDAILGTPLLKNEAGTTIGGGSIAKTNPTTTTSGTITWTIPINTTLSSEKGWIEIPMTIEGMSYVKKLSWNKSRAGQTGTAGQDGTNGYTPVKGTDYFDGVNGQDGSNGTNGVSSYLWVRYSQNANGNPMTTSPTNAKYVGIATTTTAVAPTGYASYSWSLIKGTDGVPGETGSDGQTSYLHIKYSDNGTSFTANSGETIGSWIGTYVDFTQADSLTFSAYAWNKVKGADGTDGTNGTNGINAKLVNIVPSNTYFTKTLSGTSYVINPTTITLAPTFQNCVYSKWEYSINGTTFTAITSTTVSSTLPYMNATTRVLTIPKAWTILNSNNYVVFKITSTTGEIDIQTISILYDVGELESRVSTAEQKITNEAITNTVETIVTNSQTIATKLEVQQTAEEFTLKFDNLTNLAGIGVRYLRSTLSEQVLYPGDVLWRELEVFVGSTNIALSKTVTSSKTPASGFSLSKYVDGSKVVSATGSVNIIGSSAWLQVDLGAIRNDITSIIDFIGPGYDRQHSSYKFEVSPDNVNWFTLYEGPVISTTSGYVHNLSSLQGSIEGGVVSINKDRIRVDHTGLGGQYSEMRADGYVRKWQYGEAKYLNDMYVKKFYEGGTVLAKDVKPTNYKVYLPLSFRGRTDVEIIPIPLEFGWSMGNADSDGTLSSFSSSLDLVCRVAYQTGTRLNPIEIKDLNADPPWVEIEAYRSIRNDTSLAPNYNLEFYGIDWLMFVVGK